MKKVNRDLDLDLDLQPGWLERQLNHATEEMRHWPNSMKHNYGLPSVPGAGNKSDAELELEQELVMMKTDYLMVCEDNRRLKDLLLAHNRG